MAGILGLSLAFHGYLEVGQLRRKDGILRSDIQAAGHSGEKDHELFIRQVDNFRPFQKQVAQLIRARHPDTDISGEGAQLVVLYPGIEIVLCGDLAAERIQQAEYLARPGAEFRLNIVLCDDDDGTGFRHWLQLAPGMAAGLPRGGAPASVPMIGGNTARYPRFVLAK